MTIECYHSSCPNHNFHIPGEDGPFCDMIECTATEEEMEKYDKEREEYLKSVNLMKGEMK